MHLAAAGNTLAPALAELRRVGYAVSRLDGAGGTTNYRATRASDVLTGDDVLQLLALATLLERRGDAACVPTDAEIADVLRLDGAV
jgi:hypothetical protein